jgi:hypothetical protein
LVECRASFHFARAAVKTPRETGEPAAAARIGAEKKEENSSGLSLLLLA